MKEQLRKFGTLILILALCLTSIGTTKVQAASKPSRPSVSLVKRSKTQAKIKIKKRGKATGYQIAVKTSKKARYRIVMPTKKRTVVLRKLKASKVYYVKVRAFRTKGYRIVHGKFSKPIKIGKYKKTVKKPKPKATATPEPTVTPEAPQIPIGPLWMTLAKALQMRLHRQRRQYSRAQDYSSLFKQAVTVHLSTIYAYELCAEMRKYVRH